MVSVDTVCDAAGDGGVVPDLHDTVRRSSARIRNQAKRSTDPTADATPPAKKKKLKVYLRTRRNSSEKSAEEGGAASPPEESAAASSGGSGGAVPDNNHLWLVNSRPEITENVAAGGCIPGAVSRKSAHARVRDTIRTYNKLVLNFVKEEEQRCKKLGSPKKATKIVKSKKRGATQEIDIQRRSKRPDLKALNRMIDSNLILHPAKRFGPIPGIDVGHKFFSRAEMVAVGFFSHWLNGIDYMGQSCRKGEYSNYTFPLAIAIVMSGQYEDDLDKWEDIVYTGQGGNNLLGDKRQVKDQVMHRGNLALKNSMEQCIPVRVVRGHNSKSSSVGRVYSYDGLYMVVRYWAETGVAGYTVYKFRLKRLEGQPILTTNQVLFYRGSVPSSMLDMKGLVCEDVTRGQESIPIPATNLVDDPPVPPTGYTYRRSLLVSNSVKLPKNVSGCNCKGACIDPRKCACAKLNGSDFPYVHADGGRLIEAKAVVFECGPKCGCGPDCVNRTSQKGLKYRFEVFRTPNKGWAVRSWDFIPSGAPVCEYIGKLLRADEVDVESNDNYLFDIDCLQTMKGLGGRERRLGEVPMPNDGIHPGKPEDSKSDNVPEFCIDASSTGNISRFINHSCQPNLFVQCILSSHHDMKLARVMLFASENILPMQELAYDYGYNIGSVTGRDGTVKQMDCRCGAVDCRKRLL